MVRNFSREIPLSPINDEQIPDIVQLKNVTQKFKLRYVWFNKEKKQIEIWSGNKNIFPIVQKYILNRLYDICHRDLQQGQELSDFTKNWHDKYERK